MIKYSDEEWKERVSSECLKRNLTFVEQIETECFSFKGLEKINNYLKEQGNESRLQ